MNLFRTIGKSVGSVGGGLIGGTVKVAGKAVGTKLKGPGEWMEEVGGNVQSASKSALENAGQFVDGTMQGVFGVIKKDEVYKQKGLDDLKDSTDKTIQGISSTIKYSVINASITYKGLKSGDKEKALVGLKNLGKVVAVSGLAIGIMDIVDGVENIDAEELETRNDHLNGYEHPETGVQFVEKTIEIQDGQVIEGIFPVFDSSFNVVITEKLFLESDNVHFGVANDTLYNAISNDPNISSELGLSQFDVQALENGQTPEGFTWHHNEEPGILQLVDDETHAQTAHTGGRAIWGGGSQYR